MNRTLGRNTAFITLVALLALAAPGAGTANAAGKPKAAPIAAKIGVISILTGQGAGYGEAITNGFKLARDEINAKGDVKIDLVIEDSSGKQEQALAAAQKLINSYNVAAILGPTLSTEMKVVGPEANASGVPIMGTSTTAAGITQIGKYVFRNSLPESLAIPASIKSAVRKYKIRKVALLYGNDDVFTKSGFDTMKKVSEDLGLKILTIQEFQKGQADYKAQLTTIKSLSPDAIFCSALYEEGAVILSQARKMGITVPFVGGNGFNSPKIAEIAGPAADGVISGSPWFVGKDDARSKAFVAAFRAAYGHDPDQFAAQAYDTLFILAAAFDRAGGTQGAGLRDALLKTDSTGLLGPFRFTADRDPASVEGVVVTVIKGGKFVPLN